MKKKFLVTIIGRSNIGKSALFNKLADSKRALVFDTNGVTRDPMHDDSSWKEFQYTIADTAGFITEKKIAKDDIITKLAITKAKEYLQNADIILFMIDGSVGYTQEDMQLFSSLKKLKKEIIIVVNKGDRKESIENMIYITNIFKGFSIIKISAMHSININNLQDLIISFFPKDSNTDSYDNKEKNKIAILGKPNVGKSSIMNILIEKNISIISSIAGTTRETISEDLTSSSQSYILSDTAGVRKSRAVNERIEELMVSNTMNTIQNANIIIMVFDITEENISDQDIKLISYAWNTLYKAILVIWNKVDLIQIGSINKFINNKISQYRHIFDNIPQITFSTVDHSYKKEKIIDQVNLLSERYNQFLDSKEIKIILKDALFKNPIYKMKQKLDFQKLNVSRTAPPTIIIYSRQKMLFTNSEITFLQKKIRAQKDLFGIPIKITIK